jgi:hypothetical protein
VEKAEAMLREVSGYAILDNFVHYKCIRAKKPVDIT